MSKEKFTQGFIQFLVELIQGLVPCEFCIGLDSKEPISKECFPTLKDFDHVFFLYRKDLDFPLLGIGIKESVEYPCEYDASWEDASGERGDDIKAFHIPSIIQSAIRHHVDFDTVKREIANREMNKESEIS